MGSDEASVRTEYLLAVRTGPGAGCGPRKAWRTTFFNRLRGELSARIFDEPGAAHDEWPAQPRSEGVLFASDGVCAGTYRFIDLAEARSSFGEEAWFDLDTRWPFVGPVQGFVQLRFDHDLSNEDERDFVVFIADRMLFASHGFLVSLARGVRIDAVVEEEFTLENATWKHGFKDGSAALEGNAGPHAEYIRGALLARLRELGLTARFITFSTGHNPFRFEEVFDSRGSSEEGWRIFERHKDDLVRLWVFNEAAGDSDFAALFAD